MEETPEALEGLSWSAWWLDNDEAVFDAREHALRLYRERGDATGAARGAGFRDVRIILGIGPVRYPTVEEFLRWEGAPARR